MLAAEQLVDQLKEGSRLRALDYSMIVGTAYSYRFTDAQLRQRDGRHCLILRGIFDRAGRNDHRLSRHQARRGGNRSNRSGIG